MAAEAIEKATKARGIKIKVETQGSIGIENRITMEDVKNANAIILYKGYRNKRERQRFDGKLVVNVGVSDAIRKSTSL